MSSLSSARTDLVASFPPSAETQPTPREVLPGIATLGIMLVAVVWAAFAEVRSQPLPGETGPEAAALTQVDGGAVIP